MCMASELATVILLHPIYLHYPVSVESPPAQTEFTYGGIRASSISQNGQLSACNAEWHH